MAERTVTGYQRLFEVRLLHHYWLDEGQTVFDALPDSTKNQRLLTYDARSFLSVAPTAATEKLLKGLRCVSKNTALGWVVAAPKAGLIPDDAVFEFVLTVQAADFFHYTALTLPEGKIHELYYPPEDKMYQYKENVPVLSNLTGVSRGTGVSKSLFLSKEIPAITPTDRVESLVLAGSALRQLTSDQPGAGTRQLSAQATNMPVFLHQDDIPVIVTPAGLTGAPARGILLSGEIPDNVFALIRIAAVKPGDADFSCTAGGLPKADSPVFQIRFKNRSTVWRYFNKNTGALTTTEPNPLPLTRFGNAGTKQKPSQGFIKASFDSGVTNRITEIFSGIFE